MFDISFMELVLIGIVALLVVGPERLPGAVKTATLWIGDRAASTKSKRMKEINSDEIKRQLHNESILADIKKGENPGRQARGRQPSKASKKSISMSKPPWPKKIS